MKDNNKDYMEGVRAAQSYFNGQGYAGYTRNIRAEDAIKLFLPPVVEMMTQISMPLPKPRKDWLRGFNEEKAAIIALRENDER